MAQSVNEENYAPLTQVMHEKYSIPRSQSLPPKENIMI